MTGLFSTNCSFACRVICPIYSTSPPVFDENPVFFLSINLSDVFSHHSLLLTCLFLCLCLASGLMSFLAHSVFGLVSAGFLKTLFIM